MRVPKSLKWLTLVAMIQLMGMAVIWQGQITGSNGKTNDAEPQLHHQRQVLQHREIPTPPAKPRGVYTPPAQDPRVNAPQMDYQRAYNPNRQRGGYQPQAYDRQDRYYDRGDRRAYDYYAPPKHAMELIDPNTVKGKSVVFEEKADMESYSEDHLLILYSHVNSKSEYDPPLRHNTILSLLKVLTAFMEKHQLQYWLSHGTLLGAYRNKGFIPWDVDADVGVETQTHNKLVEMMKEAREKNTTALNFWGNADVQMVVREGQHKHIIPYKFVNVTNGMYVDFLLFHESSGDYVMNWPDARVCKNCPLPPRRNQETKYIINKDILFPLHLLPFEGHQLPAPADAEAYLTHWYGDLSPPRIIPYEYMAYQRKKEMAERGERDYRADHRAGDRQPAF
ncbi:hypothetical protein PROFUN_10688 [Planoprotostelium fungivorum]|uniref:LicD/FKTN/FKRP nucleotidyltransferase domain-containing protein n=1 Tax=Planoprotostelium fungivorum TaxID=1890364 RepID=A0A2P6N9K5_9EUKA|nr:hypothetical protein PROFUN_10688 [Planoprotostelium fungivorum]